MKKLKPWGVKSSIIFLSLSFLVLTLIKLIIITWNKHTTLIHLPSPWTSTTGTGLMAVWVILLNSRDLYVSHYKSLNWE